MISAQRTQYQTWGGMDTAVAFTTMTFTTVTTTTITRMLFLLEEVRGSENEQAENNHD